MYNIQNIVAQNIANYRKRHQLSLEKLSTLTGVSKNMLSQIEKGVSNPTITTLWKIANGLHLSLSQLTAESENDIDFIDETDIIPIQDDKVTIYPYFPYDEHKKFEMFKMEIQGNGKMTSAAHHQHSEEYIIVNTGVLEIEVNNQIYSINHNQALRFKSDVPHTYRNPHDTSVNFTATIYYQ